MREPLLQRTIGATIVMVVALAGAGTALAQNAAPPLSADETRACLCMKSQLDQTNADLQAQHATYEQRRTEFKQVDAELSAAQRQAQGGDYSTTARMQSLIDRRNFLRSQLQDEAFLSGYSEKYRQYNSDRQAYETQCRTRPMLKVDVEAAQKNPQCP